MELFHCGRCDLDLPREAFGKGANRGGVASFCKPCRKVYAKAYHAAKMASGDSEYRRKRRANSLRWKRGNPERYSEDLRIWREKHPEQVKKYAHGSYARHAEKRRQAKRKYRAENVDLLQLRSKERYAERRRFIDECKSKPCVDCGVQYQPPAMQFDHRESAGKCFNIGSYMGGRPLHELLAEIEKCDVVCANCHAMRTHRRRQEKKLEREGRRKLPASSEAAGVPRS